MGILKTYIQQMHFDGTTYSKGVVVDLLDKFGIACEEFPFKLFPEAKELPQNDWPGEDGKEVYVPKEVPLKAYDIDVTFIYKGTEANMRKDIKDFILFLYGRNSGAAGASLAVFDEHIGFGRKDVRCTKVSNELFYNEDYDDEKLARFKVTFSVDDPMTEVTATYYEEGGVQKIYDLEFTT